MFYPKYILDFFLMHEYWISINAPDIKLRTRTSAEFKHGSEGVLSALGSFGFLLGHSRARGICWFRPRLGHFSDQSDSADHNSSPRHCPAEHTQTIYSLLRGVVYIVFFLSIQWKWSLYIYPRCLSIYLSIHFSSSNFFNHSLLNNFR